MALPSDGPSARRTQREFQQGVRRKSLARTLLVLMVCVALLVGVVGFVGSTAFRFSVDSQMSLESDAAVEALVAPGKDADSYFVLVSADLDDDGLQKLGDGPDALSLVRINHDQQQVVSIVIPAHSLATLSDGKTYTLREAGARGDDELIKAVSGLLGVDIAHFVKTDAQGIKRMTESMGGASMNLLEEIDDPMAGPVYIASGEQTLDESQILTFLRATNLKDGLEAQASNQTAFMTQLALDVLDGGAWSFMRHLDSLDGAFSTDVKMKDAEAIAKALRGATADCVQGALIPGYERTSDGKTQYICSNGAVAEMLERVDQGLPLIQEDEGNVAVDPGSFTITVRNGSGVTGGATEISETLTNYGYNVTEVGNTDTYAYTETLVIYTDSAFADACEVVVDSLGSGRVVNGAGFYTFDTDVLVVLGSDWAPIN